LVLPVSWLCKAILRAVLNFPVDAKPFEQAPLFLIENALLESSIIHMSILRCVFFYCMIGQICRSVAATIAVLDRQKLPVSGGDQRAS
jgi:hypothetical protein